MDVLLPESARQAHPSATLDDKYTLTQGRAFMSGVQALVRLPLLQRQRDALNGLNTAGFISGYRGSPLGGYDQALVAAQAHLQANHIVFQPEVNEELAATAVGATQQLDLYPASKKFDGVFGIWYGKGPGVDRSSDVFKHANNAGTARHGGVLAVAGDDHVSKSSTAAHQSDHNFKACGLPVFFPSDVQGILELGLHAHALSRFSGVWAGMKTIQELVESSASVQMEVDRVKIILPEDFEMPAGGVHIRWPDAPLDQEARLMNVKWYAALAYVRANRLNHNVIASAHDRFGIIASGKAFNDTRQALADLELDEEPAISWASGCTRSMWSGRWKPASRMTLPKVCRRFWWSRRNARSSNTSSRKRCTTGASGPTWWASLTAMRTVEVANGVTPIRPAAHCCAPTPICRPG